MQAQIDKDIARYQKPRVVFVTGRKAGPYQAYVSSCLTRILDAGNLNYPSEARGKLYGSVRVTFRVSASGALEKTDLEKSSGHSVLDSALMRAIQLATPFGEFPSEFGDVAALSITQTFSFDRGEYVDGLVEP
jgi:protein TonB